MRFLFLLLVFLIASPAFAARVHPTPDVCDGLDNNADRIIDNPPGGCPISAAFSNPATGVYIANVKDGQYVTYTTDTDALSLSGTYLKKAAGTHITVGQIALQGTFANDTYYADIRHRTSSFRTFCADKTVLPFTPNTLTQCAFLSTSGIFQWEHIGRVDTAADSLAQRNGTAQATYAYNGAGTFYIKTVADIHLDRVCLWKTSLGTTRPSECDGTPAQADYTILRTTTAPTTYDDALFNNANVLNWSGYDDTGGLSCTVKALWNNTTTDRMYLSVNCADTDDELPSPALVNDSAAFYTQAFDGVGLKWRGDLTQANDTDMYEVTGDLNNKYWDGDYSGAGGTRNSTVNLTTSITSGVVASTSWNIFLAFDLGSDLATDTIGLCNFAIQDKDSGVGSTYKLAFGTNINGMAEPNQFGTCQFTSTLVGGAPSTPTAGALTFINVQPTSFVGTWQYDTVGGGNGQCSMKCGTTTTGPYPLESGTFASNGDPGICNAPLSGLSPSTTYYCVGTSDAGGGVSDDTTEASQATAAATATLYVDTSVQGGGTCADAANACLMATALAAAVEGDIIQAAGTVASPKTYTGGSSMIAPPVNKNGTAAKPITVKCAEDGGCRINAELAAGRTPILLDGNDYWIIEGFDVYNSAENVVTIQNSANNNIIRRVVAWDASASLNRMVFAIQNDSRNNLLEDVAGFGAGRKILQIYRTSGPNTVRRMWAQWSENTITGPKMPFSLTYNSHNNLFENVIATWDEVAAAPSEGQRYGLLSMDTITSSYSTDYCTNGKILGSLAYLRSGDTAPNMHGMLRTSNDVYCLEYRDLALYIEPGTHTNIPAAFLQNDPNGGSTSTKIVTDVTTVGTTAASTIGSQWSVTNAPAAYASIAAMNTAGANPFQTTSGTGGRMCYRYVDGVLGTTKLWPWPMDARIGAAWDVAYGAGAAATEFGSLASPITTLVEGIFGTIPAGCKS